MTECMSPWFSGRSVSCVGIWSDGSHLFVQSIFWKAWWFKGGLNAQLFIHRQFSHKNRWIISFIFIDRKAQGRSGYIWLIHAYDPQKDPCRNLLFDDQSWWILWKSQMAEIICFKSHVGVVNLFRFILRFFYITIFNLFMSFMHSCYRILPNKRAGAFAR